MVVAVCYLELFDRSSSSLKEKRRLLNSLKERLKNRFNICIIEADHQDLWQRSRIAIITAGEQAVVDRTLNHVVKFVERMRRFQVLDCTVEKR